MKKLALFLLLGSLVIADQKGVIESIDHQNKTITVNGSLIKVLPNTKIEEDSCWLAWDISKKFADLRVGDIVELDLFYSGDMLTASKIEIQCVRNRAY
ncbi:DUF5666 domain-containing protein [Helicobacter pametensis]|uniref:DUF5666 domain-containing protein n=1 Tax=Helicobacter pametensis TaxID=95149 RepID=UPI0004802971|nr:DUF5666 domain-containing protein [Helicobacter pametensis]